MKVLFPIVLMIVGVFWIGNLLFKVDKTGAEIQSRLNKELIKSNNKMLRNGTLSAKQLGLEPGEQYEESDMHKIQVIMNYHSRVVPVNEVTTTPHKE